MDKATFLLKEWIITFIKNRDLVFKTIKKIEEKGDSPNFIVDYGKETYSIICVSKCSEELLNQHKNTDFFRIATFNSRENLSFLLSNWDNLSSFQHLTIYFINPFCEGENKWILRPYNHAKIAEKASLRLGIQSLFSAVEEVREEDLKRANHS